MTINPDLQLPPDVTVADLERVLAPVVLEHDEHDPWACHTCDLRPATLMVTFPDDHQFEVCGPCSTDLWDRAIATITPIPDLRPALVQA